VRFLTFLFLFAVAIATAPYAIAQRDYIGVSNEVNDDRYEFSASNTSSRVISVVVFFPKLQYLRSTSRLPYVGAVQPGRTRLFELQQDGAGTPDFSYSYWSYYGLANPKVKDVLYSMPFQTARKVKVGPVIQSKEMLGKEGNEDYWFYAFRLKEDETITAARGGRIERIVKDNQGDDASLTFSRKRNRIEIRHKDGTLGIYENFKNGSSKVNKGQDVLAGEPLASAHKDAETGRAALLFGVTYLQIKVVNQNDPKSWSKTKYVLPKFKSTSGDKYINFKEMQTSYIDEELITQEMSKREKKKYLKGNK